MYIRNLFSSRLHGPIELRIRVRIVCRAVNISLCIVFFIYCMYTVQYGRIKESDRLSFIQTTFRQSELNDKFDLSQFRKIVSMSEILKDIFDISFSGRFI